jgi:AcrR family transcriptional regulator
VGTSGEDGDAGAGSRIDRRRSHARRRPSEAYLRRRAELEFAAAAVMRRKGFHDMTLRDIAEELGADRASIYYYVAGKEELLADMVHRALLENEQALAELAETEQSAAAKLRAVIGVLMRQYDRHFPYLYIWVHEDLSRFDGIRQNDLEPIIDLSQREFEFVEGLVREAVTSGEFTTTLPVGVVAQSIIGLVAWTFRWYEPGHTLSAQALADGLADIALSGLVTPG